MWIYVKLKSCASYKIRISEKFPTGKVQVPKLISTEKLKSSFCDDVED